MAATQSTDSASAQVPTARRVAACGLLAFITSFLPWYSVSGGGITISANAWSMDYAWVPMLLLFALGVAVAAPAFGGGLVPESSTSVTVAGIGLACTIIVVIRWLTYPTASDVGVSAGAGFGTYIGLIIAIIVAVFGFLADSGPDGLAARLVAAFKQRPPSGSTPPGS